MVFVLNASHSIEEVNMKKEYNLDYSNRSRHKERVTMVFENVSR